MLDKVQMLKVVPIDECRIAEDAAEDAEQSKGKCLARLARLASVTMLSTDEDDLELVTDLASAFRLRLSRSAAAGRTSHLSQITYDVTHRTHCT